MSLTNNAALLTLRRAPQMGKIYAVFNLTPPTAHDDIVHLAPLHPFYDI